MSGDEPRLESRWAACSLMGQSVGAQKRAATEGGTSPWPGEWLEIQMSLLDRGLLRGLGRLVGDLQVILHAEDAGNAVGAYEDDFLVGL